ncbi:hypothetical protein WJX82_000225 [Trebouxia sp. C0006]
MRRATCHGRLLWVLRQEAGTASAYEQQIYTNRSAGWQASPAGGLPSTSASDLANTFVNVLPSRTFCSGVEASNSAQTGQLGTSQFIHNGTEYSFETGNLAQLSDGSSLVKFGNTWVLAAVTSSDGFRVQERSKPNITVEYREPVASVGRMPGGRAKIEGGPNQSEEDTALLIEKAILPLFAPGFTQNVTVTATVLCSDGAVAASSVALNAVSAALMCSDIPWEGPLAAVQIAHSASGGDAGQTTIQPTSEQLLGCGLSGLYVGTADTALLADFQGREVSKKAMRSALQAAQAATQQILRSQQKLVSQQTSAKPVKPSQGYSGCDPAAEASIMALAVPLVKDILSERNADMSRVQRLDALREAKTQVVEELTKQGVYRFQALRSLGSGCATQTDVDFVWQDVQSMVIRDMMTKDNLRADGRGLIDSRPASYQVGVLPVVHGSALAGQGQSQALVTATIGEADDQAKSEGITGHTSKQLMVQFGDRMAAAAEASTSGRDRIPDPVKQRVRRNTGRMLESRLSAAFPSTLFPFAVRLNVDVLAADGSETMAALSAASLALADAGVPVRAQVAGTQVAAFTASGHPHAVDWNPSNGTPPSTDSEQDSSLYEIVVDPQEAESSVSDLLLQLVGTDEGITGLHVESLQKGGVPFQVVTAALSSGWQGLQEQHSKLADIKAQVARNLTNKMGSVVVPQDKIGKLIGPRGAVINKIRADTGSLLSIEEAVEQSENATVHFFCPDTRQATAVEQAIRGATGVDLFEGSVHTVKVVRLMDYGAIVEFPSGSSSLLHISQLSSTRVKRIEDVLSLGQELQVKVMGHDARGNLQISHKALSALFDDAEGDRAGDDKADDSPSAKRPYQAVNARFRQSERGSRDFRQQKPRIAQSS